MVLYLSLSLSMSLCLSLFKSCLMYIKIYCVKQANNQVKCDGVQKSEVKADIMKHRGLANINASLA